MTLPAFGNRDARSIGKSVIIPTLNRADILRSCLDAIACQTAAPDTFEIIIVDNNSTDHTRDVVRGFGDANPKLTIRYLLETAPGASAARNCGVRAATGGTLFFVDDDSIAAPEWLETLHSAFGNPEMGCAGGPIDLDYRGQERPRHLLGDLQGLLGAFQLPYDEPTVVSDWTELPWGSNMAFRREVFSEGGMFRTDLGPQGDRRLNAEETEFIDRIRRSGWKVVYIPGARVRHGVPPERLARAYLYRAGRSLAASHVILTHRGTLRSTLRWFASDLWFACRLGVRFLVALMTGKRLWFDDFMRFWMVAMRIPMRVGAIRAK
jgi:glycosyltransferase involved in cell wall biosynthesis